MPLCLCPTLLSICPTLLLLPLPTGKDPILHHCLSTSSSWMFAFKTSYKKHDLDCADAILNRRVMSWSLLLYFIIFFYFIISLNLLLFGTVLHQCYCQTSLSPYLYPCFMFIIPSFHTALQHMVCTASLTAFYCFKPYHPLLFHPVIWTSPWPSSI